MKIPAYLVEYSDDMINWHVSSVHLHLINAVDAADVLSYPFRISRCSLEVGETFNKEQIAEVRNTHSKLTKTLTELFQ
jgi:hypothetical protein